MSLLLSLLLVSLAHSLTAQVEPELDCGEDHAKKEQESAEGRAVWCEGRDLYGRWTKDGPYLGFDGDGQLLLIGEFRDGKRHGAWRSFRGGQQVAVERYNFGQRVGANTGALPAPRPAAPGETARDPVPGSAAGSGSELPPPNDDLESSDLIHSNREWSAAKTGVQFGFGALGALLAVVAGGGGGVLLGNSACGGTPVRELSSTPSACQTWFIAGGLILAYVPLNAFGVWLGGTIMGGRGTYGSTVIGSVLNLALAFLPSVGIVIAAFSAGPIIMYHESEQPHGDFLSRGPAPLDLGTRPHAELMLPLGSFSF